MNYLRIALARIEVTVAYFLYGFLVEGLLIRKDFAPYTALYRSAESAMRHMPLGFAGVLVAVFVAAMMYAKGYEGGSGVAEGARFGLLLGIFVACTFVGVNYATLNIGKRLALELAISAIVQ